MCKIVSSSTELEDTEVGDVKKVRDIITRLNAERWTGGMLKGNEIHKMLGKALDQIEKAPDGEDFLRNLAAAQIRGIANDNTQVTAVEALSAQRYLSMLSKLTTVVRNLAGNSAFDIVESMSNNMAVPLDMLLGFRTGRRTTTVDKSVFSSAKWRGMVDGAMRAYIETALDAPIEDGANRWEMRNGRTFKMAKPADAGVIRKGANNLERFMSTMEKWQRYLLTVSDEFYKGGIKAETQRGIDKLKAKGKLEQDALEDWAMQTALERTFQNEGLMTKALDGLRGVGNLVGVRDYKGNHYGLGDMAMPFARVPANIAAQIGNYTVPGAIKAAVEIGNVLRLGNKATAEQQARAVRDFGRAFNGMSFTSLLVAAALKGILHVAGLGGDDDETAIERDSGLIGTQLNWSALERALKGESTEYQDGDTLVSVGGLEPLNGPMAFAAFIADGLKDGGYTDIDGAYLPGTVKAMREALKDPNKLLDANFHTVLQAMHDLPALSTLSSTYDAYKYSDEKYNANTNPDGSDWKAFLDAGAQFLGDSAASHVPNVLGGIASGRDQGRVRDTRAQNHKGLAAVPEEAINAFKAKIPGLRETLPQALNGWGEERQTTATPTENWLNANILPFGITHYRPDEVSQELLSLRENGADVKLPARNAPKSVPTKDGNKQLTPAEQREYLQVFGPIAKQEMTQVMRNPDYKGANAETRANVWGNIKSYSYSEAQQGVGGKPKDLDWYDNYPGSTADRALAAAWWSTARGTIDKSTTLSNPEKIQAVANVGGEISDEMAATLLAGQLSEAGLKKYNGAIAIDISPELYAQILMDTTNEKMPANGINGEHKRKVTEYLAQLVKDEVITQEQMDYLLTLKLG